jgi:hypothetical protein
MLVQAALEGVRLRMTVLGMYGCLATAEGLPNTAGTV